MEDGRLSTREWIERIVLALLFVAIGSLIMIAFNPWRRLLDRSSDYLGRIGVIVLLSIATVLIRKNRRYETHAKVIFALLVMSIAASLDWILGIYLLDYVHLDGNTPVGFALQKLNELAIVASVWLALQRRGAPAAALMGTIAMLVIPGTMWNHYFVVLVPFAAMAWPSGGPWLRVGLLAGAAAMVPGFVLTPLGFAGALLMATLAAWSLWPRTSDQPAQALVAGPARAAT